jgi:tetratricopeptide (TPR) repeat protein
MRETGRWRKRSMVRARIVLAVAVATLVIDARAQPPGPSASPGAAPSIRAEVFDKFAEVEACSSRQDAACALDILNDISTLGDLSVYESARLQYFYGYVYHQAGDDAAATKAFEALRALPREQVPPRLVAVALKNLASLYAQDDRYRAALAAFEERSALEPPTADDFLFHANLLYTMRKYADTIPVITQAIETAAEPTEYMYEILLYSQYRTGDLDATTATLEVLDTNWPGSKWADLLAEAKNGQLQL